MHIPCHITALYVFAVVNLIALCHITLVEANIAVLNQLNETILEMQDQPATFGPDFPSSGLWGHIYCPRPEDACADHLQRPPYNNTPWIALVSRGGDCSFDEKVAHAEGAGYIAALVHNVGSDKLVPMAAGKKEGKVGIPSAFIGESDGIYLKQTFSGELKYFIVIDNSSPVNVNMFLLPFAVVVGVCFLLMLVFIIAKWVRDYRKRRRSRLSKQNLKKIPVKKFKKGDPYDVCAICLDEYEEGEKLRILPCAHGYHMKCIDPWLTKNKRNCPVCKRKVLPGDETSSSEEESDDDGDATEHTPLLTAQSGAQVHRVPQPSTSSAQDDDSQSSNSYEYEQGIVASTSQSTADIHNFSEASPRHGSYGSTQVLVAREVPETSSYGSINSYHGDEELVGAVGGREEPEGLVEDHFDVHGGEMRGLVSGGDTASEDGDSNNGLFVKIFARKGKKKQRQDENA